MTRISSGAPKSGPPAHSNRYAFTHNRASKLTQRIYSSPILGLCSTCHDIIEWRKRYRKYKPLSVPKKCVRCQEKTICEAYHVVCKPCAVKDTICAKCLQPNSNATSNPDIQVVQQSMNHNNNQEFEEQEEEEEEESE